MQIGGDARKLQRDYPGIQPRGLLELNNVGRTVDPSRFNNRTKPGLVGLQELCGIYLDHYLAKDSAVRQGKWNLDLDDDQIYCEPSSFRWLSTSRADADILHSATDAANDVFSSLHIFLALQALARPEDDFLVHVSDNVSTASSWRPPLRKEHAFALASNRSSISSAAASTSAESAGTALRSPSSPRSHSPTVRQLESYTLWHTSSLPVEQVAITMGVKPVTVVWNILKCLGTEQGSSLDFIDERLLNAVEEVGGGPDRMRQECWEVLRDARRRESVRLGKEEEE